MNTKYRLSVRLYIIFITLITIYLSLNVFIINQIQRSMMV